MHSLNLVYTFRAVPLIELCNGMTIGNVLLCVCTQAVNFYTSEGRAQCFAFEGNNKSQRCVCVCIHACRVIAVADQKSCAFRL